MSVHCYRTISEGLLAGLPRPIFSYLDPRRQRMMFDPPPGSSNCQPFEVGLATDAAIDLKTLLRLHDYTIKRQSNTGTPPKLKSIQAELLRLSLDRNSIGNLSYWRTANLKRSAKFKPEADLRMVPLNATLKAPLDRLKLCFMEGLAESESTLGQVVHRFGLPSATALAKWLDGTWLEDFVFDYLVELRSAGVIDECLKGIEVTINRANKNLQIDAVAIRGYQLFLISSYSGKLRGTAKEHLMEAVTRARQIGGDDARAATIFFDYENSDLAGEVTDQLEAEGQVKVFEPHAFVDFHHSLERWFTGQPGR